MPDQVVSEFKSIVDKSKYILLITPENPSADVLSSAFATFWLLKKKQKNIALYSVEKFPQKISFLKEPDELIKDLAGSRDFLLMFDTKRNKIIDVKSEQKDNQFIVRITPEKGAIDPRDFSFVPAEFRYDLLIILGAASLESLGQTHQNNTDLFFEVPKINIDNHSSNENYGQVNAVDMTASSVAEICANLFLEQDEKLMDHEIAQGLLTGIISATESFQKPNTTPKAMVLAAKLMKFKADQSQVIRHLYKTKSLPFLKLWGRVMARLNWNGNQKLAWSLISTEDFVQSRAAENDVPYILEEIQKNFSQGQIFGVFYNDSADTKALFSFVDQKLASQVARLFEVEANNGFLRFEFKNKNLLEAEKEFLEKLKEL